MSEDEGHELDLLFATSYPDADRAFLAASAAATRHGIRLYVLHRREGDTYRINDQFDDPDDIAEEATPD